MIVCLLHLVFGIFFAKKNIWRWHCAPNYLSYIGLVGLELLRQLKSSSFLQDKESSDYVFSETLTRTHLFGNKAASVSSPTVTDNTFNYYYLSWLSPFVFVTKTDSDRYSFMQIFHTEQSQGNDTQRGIKFVILASTMRAEQGPCKPINGCIREIREQ